MKLYKTPDGTPGMRWSPARPKGQYEEVFIGGEGRGGMAALLNLCEAEITMEVSAAKAMIEDELGNGEEYVSVPITDDPPHPLLAERDYTASQIEDYILNRATVNQAASIMSCLGTRFGELAKEGRP